MGVNFPPAAGGGLHVPQEKRTILSQHYGTGGGGSSIIQQPKAHPAKVMIT